MIILYSHIQVANDAFHTVVQDLVERKMTLPLDEMILKSIANVVDRPDLSAKLYTSLLIVGGGGKIPGLDQYLEHRIENLTGGDVEHVEVCAITL